MGKFRRLILLTCPLNSTRFLHENKQLYSNLYDLLAGLRSCNLPSSVQLRFHHRIASKKICQGGSVRRAHTVSLRIYNGPSQLPPQPLILIFNLVRNPLPSSTPDPSSPLLHSRDESSAADIHTSEQGKPLSLTG